MRARIYNKVWAVLMLLSMSATVHGQTVRYWFDKEPLPQPLSQGEGSGQLIGQSEVDVSLLAPGLHTVYVQAVGADGRESAPVARHFVRTLGQQVQGLYWFDNHRSEAQGTLASGAFAIDVSQLNDGLHTLNYQLQSPGWESAVQTSIFVKAPTLATMRSATAICHIDGQEYNRQEVATANGCAAWDLDVNQVKQGLHRLQVQLLMPDGQATAATEAYFIRTVTATERTALRCLYCIDGGPDMTEAGTMSGGGYLFDIDVSHLREGLHRISYYLTDGQSVQTETQTAFFLKVPEGGNGIVAYDWWVNDLTDEMHTIHLPARTNPLTLSEILDVGRQPLRTVSFHFMVDADGQARRYAKNQLHLRFHNVADRSTEQVCHYIDEEVSEAVNDFTNLLSEPSHTRPVPQEGEIHWYTIDMMPGDSLLLQTSRRCMIDVFTAHGDLLYQAEGEASTRLRGIEAQDSATYYVALHDSEKGGNITLSYQYNKWTTPDLTLRSPADELIEGQSATFFIHRNRMQQAAVNVSLTCSQPSRFRFPSRVKLPMGADSVAVTVETIDDDRYNVRQTVTFSAAAPRHNMGEFALTLVDNDPAMNRSDWEALRQWQGAMGGASWKETWNFGPTPEETDSLYGVLMRQGAVRAVSLSGNGLSGALPATLPALPNVRQLDLSHNGLSGDVASLAAACPNVETLNVGYNRMSEVSEPLPATITHLRMDHQTIDQTLSLSHLRLHQDRLHEVVPSLLLYRHQGASGSGDAYADQLTMGLKAADGWAATLQVTPDRWSVFNSQRAVYQQESGCEVVATQSGEGHTVNLAIDYVTGDANLDCQTDVADLQLTVNFALDDRLPGVFCFPAANLMAGETIDVLDIVRLVNLLLSTPRTSRAPSYHDGEAIARHSPALRAYAPLPATALADATLRVEGGRLILNTMRPVAAIDIVLSKPQGQHIDWQLRDSHYQVSSQDDGQEAHFIHYSMQGRDIPAGETVLATIDGGTMTVAAAMLVSRDAQPVSVALGGDIPTGIGEIRPDSPSDHYYTPQGIRVSQPRRGLYIQRGKKVVTN